ncbi:hypothetical protein KJ068_14660 [bacterium]|nr:hypothetical protein [bacterium]
MAVDYSHMTDVELLRATTIEKDDYSPSALSAIRMEMARRGLDAAKLMDQIRVAKEDSEPEICTQAEALERLSPDMPEWKPMTFTNAVNQQLIISRQRSNWNAHFLALEKYQYSVIVPDITQIKSLLALFMRLEDADLAGQQEYNLTEWETLNPSDGLVRMEAVSQALTDADIPHVVQSSDFAQLSLFLPGDFLHDARAIWDDLDQKVKDLQDQIEKLPEKRQELKLLELYEELIPLVEDCSVPYFNRGVLQFELGRSEEAAASFIEAVAHGIQRLEEQDCLAETKDYLEHLAARLPDHLGIMHALVALKYYENDDRAVEMLYQRILAHNANDSVAHLNLGYFYHTDPEQRPRARDHFKRYLELEPRASDRVVIAELVTALEKE